MLDLPQTSDGDTRRPCKFRLAPNFALTDFSNAPTDNTHISTIAAVYDSYHWNGSGI